MSRRIRAIGEPVVPLNDKYPLAVTFIIGPVEQEDGTVEAGPIGTGFIVNVPSRIENVYFEYVVTASHVVASGRETSVRIRKRDGGSKDVPVHEWIHHPGADVAAAPFRGDGEMHLLNVPVTSLCWPDSERLHPDLGDRIYFLGLLAVPGARALAERNVPMVRSGTIGAMYQDDIPFEWPDGSIRNFQAHLIDCRSYGGFSGSPCFFQRDDQFTGVREGEPTRGVVTFLLGLISGHFDLFSSARLRGDIAEEGAIRVPVNTGVGIVTPAEKIAEVLTMEEFKDERDRIERERAARPEEGATLDSVEDRSEFDRFEALTRKLVNVPKKELDEKRKDAS